MECETSTGSYVLFLILMSPVFATILWLSWGIIQGKYDG